MAAAAARDQRVRNDFQNPQLQLGSHVEVGVVFYYRDFAAVGIRAVCIPKTESLLEEHEGRHDCAYNKSDGSRAVGVGYNLDDDSDTRRSELSVVLADYDKV
jgi:hypothetical protein